MKYQILSILLLTFCSPSFASFCTIQNLTGKVILTEENGKVKELGIQDIGKACKPMQKYTTALDSFLKLQFADQGVVFMEPESQIIIKRPEKKKRFRVFIELFEGVLDCFIEKKGRNFGIQTPVSVAGVLGTQFQVRFQEGKTAYAIGKTDYGIEIQNRDQTLMTAFVLKPIRQGDQFAAVQVEFEQEPGVMFYDTMVALNKDFSVHQDIAVAKMELPVDPQAKLMESIGTPQSLELQSEENAVEGFSSMDETKGLVGGQEGFLAGDELGDMDDEKKMQSDLSDSLQISSSPAPAPRVSIRRRKMRAPVGVSEAMSFESAKELSYNTVSKGKKLASSGFSGQRSLSPMKKPPFEGKHPASMGFMPRYGKMEIGMENLGQRKLSFPDLDKSGKLIFIPYEDYR